MVKTKIVHRLSSIAASVFAFGSILTDTACAPPSQNTALPPSSPIASSPSASNIFDKKAESGLIGDINTTKIAAEVPDYSSIILFLADDLGKSGILNNVKGFSFIEAAIFDWVETFPNTAAAAPFAKIATETIDDLFAFYSLPKTEYEIKTPLNAKDILPIHQAKALPLYLAATYNEHVQARFDITLNNGSMEKPILRDLPLAGGYSQKYLIQGNNLIAEDGPIICSYLGQPPVVQTESCAVQMIHKSLDQYTQAHIMKDYLASNQGIDKETLKNTLIKKWEVRETHVASALNAIWLRDYSAKTNKHTQKEVNDRIALYANYANTRKTSEILKNFSGIDGGQRILSLYQQDPETLFRGSGL